MWYKFSQQLNLAQQLNQLRPAMAVAAQQVYDQWDQSDPENDDLGGGGICQDIAEAIAGAIGSVIPDVEAFSISYEIGDQHVATIAMDDKEAYTVDISPGYYETGGGYNWQKIPDVQFSPDMISIEAMNYSDAQDWLGE
jgi:hypothetical protein